MSEAEIGRLLFGLCLMLSWLNSIVHIVQAKEMIYSRGMRLHWSLPTANILLTLGFASLIFSGFTLYFVQTVSENLWYQNLEFWQGSAIIALIYWIRHWEISLWRDNIVRDLGKYSPSGTCLFGYLIALVLHPYLPSEMQSTPQRMGVEIACGILGAAWFLAGWKKLEYSGIKWISDKNVGLLLAERSYLGPKILRQMRRFVISQSWLLWIIGFLGVLLELIGPIYCFSDFRIAYAIIINGLLISTGILMGYWEPEWMLSIVALTLLSI